MNMASIRTGAVHRNAVFALTLLVLAMYLTLAGPVLEALGIPYTAPYGNPIFKLHPATYLLFLTLALSLLLEGNPLVALGRRLRQMPLLLAYVTGIALACVYSLMRHGPSGTAFYVDTLTVPAVVVLVLCRFDAAQLRVVLRMLLTLMVLNAAIALGEAAMRYTLIPFRIGDEIVALNQGNEFRATALHGHPLDNALATGVVLLAMLDMPLSNARRLGLCALFVLALLAFGGRTSFVLNALVLLGYALVRGLRGLQAGRYGYSRVMGALTTAVMASPLAVGLVWASGLGDRILGRLYVDDSAEVRLRIYSVFEHISFTDLLFGISPARIQLVSAQIGLDPKFEAIENFWLLMLLQLGAFVFVAFVVALVSGLLMLWRRSGTGGRWALVVFVITASTTNSLASKCSALTELFAVLYCLGGFAMPAVAWRRTYGAAPRPFLRMVSFQ